MSELFGDQNPFQILVAVVALLTGAYTFYKSFIERAKLAVYPGDRVGFVISPRGGVSKFHLHCNLTNHAVKVGTLHRLEARVSSSGWDTTYLFAWNLFFQYSPGGGSVEKGSEAYPISVAGKSSSPMFVEFTIRPHRALANWPVGDYKFSLIGWANAKDRTQEPNVKTNFHVHISREHADLLGSKRPSQPEVLQCPVVEWSDQT
jgi:hypothetical protein